MKAPLPGIERERLWSHLRDTHGLPKSRYFYLAKSLANLRKLHDEAHAAAGDSKSPGQPS